MSKKIEFEYQGAKYTLEYNRDAIAAIESQGFDAQEFTKKPLTMGDLAFQGAFIKNHKNITVAKVKEIYSNIKDKIGLLNQLIVMIGEAYDETFNNEDSDGKNIEWKIV